jgi:uncharacterized membrane protein
MSKSVPSKIFKAVSPGVGDEGCKLPSPSRVNTRSLPEQAAVFFLIAAGLYASTAASITIYEYIKGLFPDAINAWQSTFGLIGFLFALAGASHFTLKKDFVNIMPSQGAWGFWYLPGSKEFHVAWTGVVEFVAGLWLGLSTIGSFFPSLPSLPYLSTSPISDSALVLLSLVIGVTPANIYMVVT